MSHDEVIDELMKKPTMLIRTFSTGATRDSDDGKPSYVSYLSPLVLKSFGEYMLAHEIQSNGERREPGNWKKGMPKQAYVESMFRHVMDLWLTHDGYGREAREPMIEALNAIIFNASGYLHTLLEDFYLDRGVPSDMLGEGNQPSS